MKTKISKYIFSVFTILCLLIIASCSSNETTTTEQFVVYDKIEIYSSIDPSKFVRNYKAEGTYIEENEQKKMSAQKHNAYITYEFYYFLVLKFKDENRYLNLSVEYLQYDATEINSEIAVNGIFKNTYSLSESEKNDLETNETSELSKTGIITKKYAEPEVLSEKYQFQIKWNDNTSSVVNVSKEQFAQFRVTDKVTNTK